MKPGASRKAVDDLLPFIQSEDNALSGFLFDLGMYGHGRNEKYELHRLLSTLLSMELTVDEKIGIIEKEYSIVADDRIREDVSAMCNLSQGIREKGRTEGEEKFILNMSRKGYTLEQIAECAEKTIEEAEAVIKKQEPVLA